MPASWIDRYMSLAILRVLLLLVLCIGACKDCSCESTDKKADAGYVLDEACKRSFSPALEEFEAALKLRVPEDCRYLDKVYAIEVTSNTDEMATICGGGPLTRVELADNEKLTGCFLKAPPLIVIYKRSEREMTDTAVHEWLHVLMYCTKHTPDLEHMQGELWKEYERDLGVGSSAEIKAQARAEAGHCL